ncbi:50S ribosomal protein L11 methyltransferase [Pontiella sulfatireligans]|uniref:Ribosomal protein L11 methyltransferase n=1 Tax=Pontiella sulfatireligans TaxID=2750658 RepID=A0A6C2UP41_9BACT|nr:50S ribosomal protein L11 methyltransferase [Pontiella sulfatireligans]VGO22035.1 Ribosomal protein L11 methyltransferase [Pontiella sulfatireligans]
MTEENKNSGGQLNLVVAASEVNAISEWIREALQKEPVEVTQPFAGDSRLEIYFDSLLEAQIAKKTLPADLPIQAAETKEYLEQDWTTFWRHHFKTMELGTNLRIVPEWEEVPNDGRINIIINPGLSFGTGGHFTTKFCLEALEEAFQTLKPQTMIDAGTGSGILSIAAIKLGLPKVDAFDYDPVCVDQCNENAARNGVEGQINFFQADVLEPGWYAEPADIVCANVLTSVLLEAAPLIKRATKKRMLLSGIREIEGDAVADTFIQLGCKEISRDGDGQWCGLVIDV